MLIAARLVGSVSPLISSLVSTYIISIRGAAAARRLLWNTARSRGLNRAVCTRKRGAVGGAAQHNQHPISLPRHLPFNTTPFFLCTSCHVSTPLLVLLLCRQSDFVHHQQRKIHANMVRNESSDDGATTRQDRLIPFAGLSLLCSLSTCPFFKKRLVGTASIRTPSIYSYTLRSFQVE